MAHEIDFSNDQANVAVVGTIPWHKLGQNLQPGQPIDVWAKSAGLSHDVLRSVVQYEADGIHEYADRDVLYRSDTFKPLGVVSKNYNIVQPSHVLDFFAKLAENNNFQLETAGSLSGGKRIWALAKVSDGAPVVGMDVVKPYVLLATSYDGTMATTARFTTVRVVCANTLGFATEEAGDTIKVAHSRAFNATDTRLDLGIAFGGFERFLIDARKLAKREVTQDFAVEFLKKLLPSTVSMKTENGIKVTSQVPVEETKAFKAILDLFKGEALGSDMPEAQGTAWQLLNATTQYFDHVNGRNTDTRQASAWFGQGNAIKTNARDLLLAVVA
jgi:phage/plasmid-like protein (TIGR03299 family)